MCKTPPCLCGCETSGKSGQVHRQRMLRAYVRVYDVRGKQHLVPIGWWCPGCRSFSGNTLSRRNQSC